MTALQTARTGGEGASPLALDEWVEISSLLIDLYDTGAHHELLREALQRLRDLAPSSELAVVLDWWLMCEVGVPSSGPAWSDEQLSGLPDGWRSWMVELRDLSARLPDGMAVLPWLRSRRELQVALDQLDSCIGYHEANFAFGGERAAWLSIVGPFEEFRDALRHGSAPDDIPAHSDTIYRRASNDGSVAANSERDRYLRRQYDNLIEVSTQALELARETQAVTTEPPPEPGPIDLAAAPDVPTAFAGSVFRAVTKNEAPRPDLLAGQIEDLAARDADDAAWIALVTGDWPFRSDGTFPSLQPLWSRRDSLTAEIRRLRRTLPGEVQALEGLIASDPDLDPAEELLDALRDQESDRGRLQSVTDRIGALREEAEMLSDDVAEDVLRRLDALDAQAQTEIRAAEVGLTALRAEVEVALVEAGQAKAETAIEELEDLGASALARDGRAALARYVDEGKSIPASLLTQLADKVQQVRADTRQRIERSLLALQARATQVADAVDAGTLTQVQHLAGLAQRHLDAGELLAAETQLREASALLDRDTVRVWDAADGEQVLIDHLVAYLRRNAGFAELDIRRLHVALKTKPFVILAGLTGSGKSTIARLYAEALDATAENGRFVRVAVRPNWVDETEVLGYLNPLTRRFEPGWMASLMRTCHRNPNLPVFCVLDEMNLAPVEQYLADFLSAMEEHRASPTPATIALYPPGATPENGDEWEPTIDFPDNLFVLGTVNVDETTRPLSDRVLDRASVLQLDVAITDEHHLRGEQRSLEPRWRVRMSDWNAVQRSIPSDVHHQFLVEVADLFARMGIGLGIRNHLDIEMFCANAESVLDPREALDVALLQRVIPKVRGFRGDLGPELEELRTSLQREGASRCGAVLDDWLADDRGDDAFLDGTSSRIGLVRHR